MRQDFKVSVEGGTVRQSAKVCFLVQLTVIETEDSNTNVVDTEIQAVLETSGG